MIRPQQISTAIPQCLIYPSLFVEVLSLQDIYVRSFKLYASSEEIQFLKDRLFQVYQSGATQGYRPVE